MRCLRNTAVAAIGTLILIGCLWSDPQHGITRSLTSLKINVANENLVAVEALLLAPAKQRWWISGLRATLARRDEMTEAERHLVNAIYVEYRQMIEGLELVKINGDGDHVNAVLRMTVPVGGYAFPLEFPTIWKKQDKIWRLARTNWNSRDWIMAHRRQSRLHQGPENHAGYPLFSLHRLPLPDPKFPSKIPRAQFECPPGMAPVPAGPGWMRYSGQRYVFSGHSDHQAQVDAFCIDRYEASKPTSDETFPAKDQPSAQSRPNAVPWAGVSWQEAKKACGAAGKRLCTGAEWQKAAGGPNGLLFPNGNKFDPDTCNTYDPATGPRELAKTGSFSDCHSPYGVYDMCGNISEWTSERWQEGMPDRILRGGSFNENPINNQALYPFFGWRFIGYGEDISAIHHHPPGVSHADDGFRCCSTPER
jgi:formylglycine-generating enzyme required for sulfatase activity